MRLEILGVTETKGEEVLYWSIIDTLIYGGVENNQRAAAGIGCLVQELKKVNKWDIINERIMRAELKDKNKDTIMILVTYGRNEDEKMEKR